MCLSWGLSLEVYPWIQRRRDGNFQTLSHIVSVLWLFLLSFICCCYKHYNINCAFTLIRITWIIRPYCDHVQRTWLWAWIRDVVRVIIVPCYLPSWRSVDQCSYSTGQAPSICWADSACRLSSAATPALCRISTQITIRNHSNLSHENNF